MIKNFNPYHFYTLLLFHRLKSQKHHLNSRFVAINYFKKVYDDIINGEEDETIINDCINDLRQITLGLLIFD